MARLPVVRQPARRQRQGLGRQVADAHPRQDQEAGVADHPVQALAPGRLVPADEVVAARQRPGRVGEQQAAQPAPAAIDDGVTQMRTDRAAVAQVMVPVDQFVPSRDLVRLRHHAQLQGLQPLQAAADLGARLGAGGPCRRLLRPAPLRLVLVRQHENAEFLQLFEQRRAVWTRLPPLGVCRFRCSQTVCASSLQLSPGKLRAVRCTSAIWRRVRRRPRNVVDFSLRMASSIGFSGTQFGPLMVPPGRACVKPLVDCRRRKEISHVESTAYESERKSRRRLRQNECHWGGGDHQNGTVGSNLEQGGGT